MQFCLQLFQILLLSIIVRLLVTLATGLNRAVGVLFCFFVGFNKSNRIAFGFKLGFVELAAAKINDFDLAAVLDLHVALEFLSEVLKLALARLKAICKLCKKRYLLLVLRQSVDRIFEHVYCIGNLGLAQLLTDCTAIVCLVALSIGITIV